jgi:hypothetical protein
MSQFGQSSFFNENPLIKNYRYIKVEFYSAGNVQEIEDLCQKGFREAEFIEGIMYAPGKTVIMLANFENEEPVHGQVSVTCICTAYLSIITAILHFHLLISDQLHKQMVEAIFLLACQKKIRRNMLSDETKDLHWGGIPTNS